MEPATELLLWSQQKNYFYGAINRITSMEPAKELLLCCWFHRITSMKSATEPFYGVRDGIICPSIKLATEQLSLNQQQNLYFTINPLESAKI